MRYISADMSVLYPANALGQTISLVFLFRGFMLFLLFFGGKDVEFQTSTLWLWIHLMSSNIWWLLHTTRLLLQADHDPHSWRALPSSKAHCWRVALLKTNLAKTLSKHFSASKCSVKTVNLFILVWLHCMIRPDCDRDEILH